jgi:hypothetical protein
MSTKILASKFCNKVLPAKGLDTDKVYATPVAERGEANAFPDSGLDSGEGADPLTRSENNDAARIDLTASRN